MFSDLNTQISILQSKGLTISNNSLTRKRLIDSNYYNIVNAFKKPFLASSSPEMFIPGSSFEELFFTYLFDRKLRNLFLKNILIVENSIKTKIAYEFAKTKGELGYLDISNFKNGNPKDDEYAINLITEIWKSINQRSKEPIVSHFLSNGNGIPIWALVSLLDFGKTRSFFFCMQTSEQFRIANTYFGIPIQTLISMLSNLNMFRNVCAHDNRLMSFKIKDPNKSLADTPIHSNMCIETDAHGKYKYGKHDLFSIIICFRYLLSDDEFKKFFYEFKNHVNHLKNKLTSISIQNILFEYNLPIQSATSSQLNWDQIINVGK